MVTFHDFLHNFFFHVVLKSCLTNVVFFSPYVKQSSSSLKDLLNVNKDDVSIGHVFLCFVLVMILL